MEYSYINEEGQGYIRIVGKLSFSDHSIFREILDLIAKKDLIHLHADVEGLEFVDTAGLGMLLLLKRECDDHNIGLTLLSPIGQVKKMFEIAKFYDQITIQG